MSRRSVLAFLAAALFAVGLGISGMTNPAKVLAFLDITGRWDPSLAFVMIGAVGVHGLGYRLARRRSAPALGDKFAIPTRTDLDRSLFIGSSLFGVGWGLAGYCPGPAVVSLAGGRGATLAFVVAMLGGMALRSLGTFPADTHPSYARTKG